jgi:oligopeptide transport system substrate-binding protein
LCELSTDDAIPVAWSTVGFKVISDLVFEITLGEARTAWDVKGQLLSGITGVVHETAYEAGMNEARTLTDYGTVDNPLVSYGPYTLSTWDADQLYIFDARDDYYDSDTYRIRHVRYDVIVDQSIAVDEFRAGRLDIVAASGDYYAEFKYSPYLKLTPATTFFRFAFNVAGRNMDPAEKNPILVYPEFRKAFYFAIDREEFALEVRAPSHPTQAFLGPVYLSTEYNSVSYRSSEAGVAVAEDFAPETFGYDPVQARTLFDEAYDLAVAAEEIEEGDTVFVEYKFYDVETNWKVANWVKSTVEAIFNDVTAAPRFNLTLTAVSGDALDAAWDNGDFEMTFGGWQGLNFDAPSMLGQVYNSALTYMLEKGFDTESAEVVVDLNATYVALQAWIADYDPLTATETQQTAYDEWVAVLDKFDTEGVITCTYDELFGYAYGEFYNVADVNYEGKTDDFDRITAALEGVLMDQMIAIPLFTTVAATVYSSRMVFEAPEYHVWMGWGGLAYMYIAKTE